MKSSPIKTRLGGVSSPFRDTEEVDPKVAEKYKPVVDWFKSYLGSGTYSHLEDKMRERGAKDYYLEGAKEAQEKYVSDYPYNIKGLGGDGQILGPSIREDHLKGAKGEYASGEYDESGVITINPTYSSEQKKKESKAHEIGHTDRKYTTGSPSTQQDIAERNPYYKRLVGLLKNAPEGIGEEVTKLIDEGNTQKLNRVINDWLYYQEDVKGMADNLGISENEAKVLRWAATPYEVRSELVKLRYQLEEEGIYKSTGDYKEFTKEHLDKLKKTDRKNNILLDGEFKEEDVIWFMNNIAMTKEDTQDFTGEKLDKDSAVTMRKITGGV
tara:strand:- start:721 stop:1698 length:978 start_codon:yes stop_codon:yes gene_type:complete